MLQPWETHDTGDGSLTATPSAFEIDELGLVFSRGDSHYWHMSDAIVSEEVGARVLDIWGPMSLVAVKHQPLRTLIGYQRGLQSNVLDRDELVAGFEAACETRPAGLFPYFSGFAFHAEHAWANRYVAPFGDGEIARWLRRRAGPETRVETVRPGDVWQVDGRRVELLREQAGFAAPGTDSRVAEWEPVDLDTLPGLRSPAQRTWLSLELIKLLSGEVLPWIQAHLERRTGLFDLYRDYRATATPTCSPMSAAAICCACCAARPAPNCSGWRAAIACTRNYCCWKTAASANRRSATGTCSSGCRIRSRTIFGAKVVDVCGATDHRSG